MPVKKLHQIESLLLDIIIYCTEEASCDHDVIEELLNIKERVYKLERRMPISEKE